MQRAKVTLKQLRNIIKEEVESFDHKARSEVVSSASNLMKAVEAFREDAPPNVINAVTPGLDDLYETLKDMADNPGSYVQSPPKVVKKIVKMRPVSDGEIEG